MKFPIGFYDAAPVNGQLRESAFGVDIVADEHE